MSLAQEGLKAKIKTHTKLILVDEAHPLILLANHIPWESLANLVYDDLKNTTKKGFWMVGRKLYMRTHLGIYFLKARTKKTDRDIISEIHDNPVYQAFCGSTVIQKWQCPHPTKIEEFRSRLSPEIKAKCNEILVQMAVRMGCGDPTCLDVDSTVQVANISYPTDAGLILKLAEKCKKIKDAFHLNINFNLKEIRTYARNYFFRSKRLACDKVGTLLSSYYTIVKNNVMPIVKFAETRMKESKLRLKWNLKKNVIQVATFARKYLKDVACYVREHKANKGKRLSIHAQEVACITKGKTGKKYEFGRVFQLGRIGGNFLTAICSGINLPDKKAMTPLIENHENIFGKGVLKSLSSDKGYYSKKNIMMAQKRCALQVGIQRPGPKNIMLTKKEAALQESLRCRRAGIEPLIGHAKRFGLGRSKMKNDRNTHGSGFTAIMGFNLSQLERKLKVGMPKVA